MGLSSPADKYIEMGCPACGFDILHGSVKTNLVCSCCGAQIHLYDGELVKIKWHNFDGWHEGKGLSGWLFASFKEEQ